MRSTSPRQQDRLYIGSSRGRVLATLEDTYYLKDMSAGVYEDNTWKAIAEEDYVDELGERYDYSRHRHADELDEHHGIIQ